MEQITLIQEQPVTNYTLVEVPVTSNGLTQINIPDQPMLKSYSDHRVIVKTIELIPDKVLSKAVLSGNTNAPRSELLKASLVLYCDGWEREQNVPLLRLNAFNDSDSAAATTIPFVSKFTAFENLKSVDWTKSRIQFSNGQSSAGSTYSFVFGVQYVVIDNAGNFINP